MKRNQCNPLAVGGGVLGIALFLLTSACSRAEPVAADAASTEAPIAGSVAAPHSQQADPDEIDHAEPESGASPGEALDSSFTDSNTRPEYQACVDGTGGETAALQACGDEELAWQDARLNRLYKLVMSKLPEADRTKLRSAQRVWLKQTDQTCAWDASTQGQGQMLDAQSCRLNRTTNRADELQKLAGN